eukprot:Skav209565  [mRNA]  locus=scaffold2497:833790:834131:- [translate_table: standard]
MKRALELHERERSCPSAWTAPCSPRNSAIRSRLHIEIRQQKTAYEEETRLLERKIGDVENSIQVSKRGAEVLERIHKRNLWSYGEVPAIGGTMMTHRGQKSSPPAENPGGRDH